MKPTRSEAIFGNMTPTEFGNTFFGPDDERKETCVHCGIEWYAIHYKDGLCYSCQGKGIPGKTQLMKTAKMRMKVMLAAFIIIPVIIIYFLY